MRKELIVLPAEEGDLQSLHYFCVWYFQALSGMRKGPFYISFCGGEKKLPSEKILEQKKQAVADLAEKIKGSCAGVLVEYKGINVADDTKLRKELREAGVSYSVVKNTLLSRAAKEAGVDGLDPVLEGTTALAVSAEDHVAAARILCKFAETHKFFKVKSGFVDGKVMSSAEVEELAKLPSKEVLVAKALGGLNAPISGFVTVLNGTLKGLVVALNAIAEKQSA